MSFLLDTMVVSYFLQAGREEALALAAGSASMVIVDEVREELEKDKQRGGRFKRWLVSSNIEVRPIIVGSSASETLVLLRNVPSPGKNLGERASIALAASDVSLTFVTHDRGALWLAHRELWMPGERVVGLAAFLRRLVDEKVVTDCDVIDDVFAVAVESRQRPTWWASWRGGPVAGGS